MLTGIFSFPSFSYCLSGNFIRQGSSQCMLDSGTAFADCTHWNTSSITNVKASYTFLDQLLPNISTIGRECLQNVITTLDSLYHDENGSLYPPPPSEDCTTNCVLTVRSDRNCSASRSVLLLEQVQRQEAGELMRYLSFGRENSCVMEMECCNLSLPMPQEMCSMQCKRGMDRGRERRGREKERGKSFKSVSS